MNEIFDEKNHRRKSIRLPHYDYSQNGAYFITICTQKRACIFGEVINGKMNKNELGEMVEHFWNEIPNHFPDVQLGEFIVMPNHIHGILIIDKPVGASIYRAQNMQAGCDKSTPLQQKKGGFAQDKNTMGKNTIGSIIRRFKGRCTFEARKEFFDFSWQRNYHEHIIRNEQSFEKISEYIQYNPEKWNDDMFFIDF